MAVPIRAALAADYECDFAADLGQAREMLRSRAGYDLVICDTDDPAGSALGLAEEIAAGPLDSAVIVVSAEDHPGQAKRVFEVGAYGYVVKPP